jgi:hypothetical protein
MEAELFTQRVVRSRPTYGSRNDFWDGEHAIVPPAYSNAWVTLDGELASLVRACDTPRRRGCKILGSMDEFAAWLEQHG